MRNVTALIGTPSARSGTSTTDDLGLHVTWVKGSTVPLRRFLVTATYSGLDKGGISFPPAAVAESLLSWGTWRRWRDLSELRLRLRDRAGLLATLRVGLHGGRLVLSAPGGHARGARRAPGSVACGRPDHGRPGRTGPRPP